MVETMLEKHLAENLDASKEDISFTFFLLGLAYTVASLLIACVCLVYDYYSYCFYNNFTTTLINARNLYLDPTFRYPTGLITLQ